MTRGPEDGAFFLFIRACIFEKVDHINKDQTRIFCENRAKFVGNRCGPRSKYLLPGRPLGEDDLPRPGCVIRRVSIARDDLFTARATSKSGPLMGSFLKEVHRPRIFTFTAR